MFDRPSLSFISLHVSLCSFSSIRCRFAKTNVNCLFTVSQLVQFTHRSFPIQSPAAVCLSFTRTLIGSTPKKTTLKKKKKSSLPKPHFQPQKLLQPWVELVLLEGRQQEAEGRKRILSWISLEQAIKKHGSNVSADTSFTELYSTFLISHPFKGFPEVHPFYLAAQ